MSFALRKGEKVRQGEEGAGAKREWREKSGWTVLSSNRMFLKHKESLKKGIVYRCCGSGRGNKERKTGMKA